MRLSRGHRHWVYWSGAALFVTGAIWLVYRYFLREHGEFGEPPHPMEEWWLRMHGTAAVLMLLIAGSLLPVHVRVGWHQRKNLLAGCILIAVLVLLIVSGYVLYYSDEETRPVVSMLHWIIGLGAPVALIWHIVRGRRTHSTLPETAQAPTQPPARRTGIST